MRCALRHATIDQLQPIASRNLKRPVSSHYSGVSEREQYRHVPVACSRHTRPSRQQQPRDCCKTPSPLPAVVPVLLAAAAALLLVSVVLDLLVFSPRHGIVAGTPVFLPAPVGPLKGG